MACFLYINEIKANLYEICEFNTSVEETQYVTTIEISFTKE